VPLLNGFPVELGTGIVGKKTRMMGLPDRERSLTISSVVSIQSTNVTDKQMDRQWATAKTVYMHSVAQ